MNSLRNYIGLLLVIFSIMAINASAEPGIIEGTGTHFEMNDSEYINIILNSSESIGLILESTPEMVTMDITPITGSGTSTDITLKGFSPTTTYHKYEDNYDSHVIFTTDENGSYTYTQGLLDTHTIYIQPRPSTIHIEDIVNGRDCTSVGTWSTSSKTCTLTTDLSQSIEIDSNNILLDGNGHTAAGTNTGNGILIHGHTGVIVKNLRITNFNRGIDLTESDNNNIKGNTIYGNQRAIRLSKSHNNLIYNNLFDNYNNNFLSDSDNNVWNMAKTLGTNIVGGIYLGGNFWDNPSRFSRTCTDSGDGICDSIYTLDTTNIDNLPLATYVSDTTPPNSVDNLHNITYAQTYINWTWINPADPDFDHVDVYIDSGPIVSAGNTEFYSATGLSPDTEHIIHTRTVDTVGNVNATWKSHTARTSSVPDTTPPASVTDLHNLTPGTTFIEWVWINPTDVDFDHVEIYIDGMYKENVMSAALPYYAIGSIDPDTEHEISTRTVDSSGNINYTWKNDTARTATIPIVDNDPPVTTIALTGDLKPSGWYNSSVDVTLSATDDISGVDYTEYRLLTSGPFVLYTGPFTISDQGETPINYRSADNTANVELINADTLVKIDTIDPSITIDGVTDGITYDTDVTPTITVTDAHILSWNIKLNESPYTSGTPITANGNYWLNITATDVTHTVTKNVNFVIDRTVPTLPPVTCIGSSTNPCIFDINYNITP